MAGDHGDRSEKPSPKRVRDARERGQVATSRDLSTAAGSLAATGVLLGAGPFLLSHLLAPVTDFIGRAGQVRLHDLTPDGVMPIVISGGTVVLLIVGPVALAAAAAGMLATIAQTGFVVAPAALKLQWDRLSPVNGFRKLAPSRSGVDTLKAVITSAAIAALAWRIGQRLGNDANGLAWMGPNASAARGWTDGLRLLWYAGLALLAVGGLDYGVQRWRLWSSLKMTRQEVRDEARLMEGNPEIRARVRRIQREMVRRRMLHAVPRATVVLTNPTHYAVALEYRREKNAAPVVVAKGRDRVAARIREIARQHDVPIVENPPLARTLFSECEIGDTIPGALFGAVAEVLAYLIRIKQLVL